MEGHSLGDCIEEQWRINDRHHKHKKRQYDEKEWDEESNDAEGRGPKRKQHVQAPNQMFQVMQSTKRHMSWGSE
jgi:hypothetical protein